MVIYCIQLFGLDALEYRNVPNAIVVTGTARVTCGEETFSLHENEST